MESILLSIQFHHSFSKRIMQDIMKGRFVDLFNSIDIANGLTVTGRVKWEKVLQLENSTSFSFVKNDEEYPQKHS